MELQDAHGNRLSNNWLPTVFLNVAVGAVLVVSNKVILLESMPASSAALTFSHYLSTLVVLRVISWKTVPDNRSRVPTVRVAVISALASLSVGISNLTLKVSSVSFHQVSRLSLLPGGLLADYILYKKTRTPLEISYVVIVAMGVFKICFSDPTATLLSCALAAVSISATLVTAISIKLTCAEYNLSAFNLSYLMSPWGTLLSFCWLISGLISELGFDIHGIQITQLMNNASLEKLVTLFAFNGLFAVLLNVSSTWCAAHCSTLLYALLGQGKTLATIALSAVFFRVQMPVSTIISLCMSVSAFAIFIVLEQRSAEQHAQLQGQRISSNHNRNPRWAIFCCFIIGGLLVTQDGITQKTADVTDIVGKTTILTRQAYKNSTQTTTNLLKIQPSADEIDFRIVAISARIEESMGCGGCTVLHLLANELSSRSYYVKTLVHYNQDVTTIDCDIGDNTVVVFPEGFSASCKQLPRVQIRWILAPMGAIAPYSITHAWPQTDWVYNYGVYAPGAKIKVPDSNLLVVLRNPYPGDEYDLLKHPEHARSGRCYTIRKRDKFHDLGSIRPLHDPSDTLLADSLEGSVQDFLVHEYFVSYDPYTFLTFAAAMLGCVSIVHPLGNFTKEQWLLSTAWGPYIRESGRHYLMEGIAYGDSQEEIERAREHMHLVRKEFFRIKQWGSGTVDRFLSHLAQPNGTAEGQHFVGDFYPPGWNPGKFTVK